MLTVYDELPHPARDDPHWRESWYLNFFDHSQEVYGIAWMGVRPPKGHGELLFAIGEGNAFLHKFENFAIPIPADIGRERTGFGPAEFTVVEPYKRWNVDFRDGDVEAHLEWEALTPVYNWEWWASTKSWHFQHPGRITGTIRIGDRRIDFTGMGERDRAWGQRDNAGFRAVHWMTSQFPSGTCLEAMHIQGPTEGELYGFAHRDGRSELIVDYELDIAYAYPGGPPASALITMTDEAGRDYRLEQEIMNVFSMGQADAGEEARQFFTFNRYRLDGEPGYGMMDHWWGDATALADRYTARGRNLGELLSI
ncbi:hypothetical protein HUN08_14420 [Gordonia sp. X0973]|uniref:DUF7065 domain-containing protein n=1 Tax=Gordonia sp. X0973 TaxID=2742602 RepID=UPI000F53C07E|nr:hypothetical protein [Gordonia sp. X0973]QKT08260.1 hypothetical protein HUN08_14420 [Gordonia sp. X0973]